MAPCCWPTRTKRVRSRSRFDAGAAHRIWLVKCSFSLLLLLAQVAVLAGFVVGLGITKTNEQLLETVLGMLIFGLFALSWGLLFSARGDYVLNVIGLALVGQIAAVLLAAVLCLAAMVVSSDFLSIDGELVKRALFCLCALGLTVSALRLGPPVLPARS